MRQTGRTSRIADFTIDQLFSVGECIVTDHYVFEYPSAGESHLQHFISKVYDRFKVLNYTEHKYLDYSIVKLSKIPMVHFKIKHKENENI
jgi:hypothetical protein